MSCNKGLCLELMSADSEAEVIKILTREGWWNDTSAWRNYGDSENPYGVIGNQQANPEAALAEKLTNAGDAVLMLACRQAGIDPEGDDAPRSISAAVKQFFGSESSDKLNERITVAATGKMATEGYPCISIADNGEGQTPDMMPDTFLSLNKSNKDRIPFVQGRFNQGGTGVLRHGGKHRLQLIVTKRNPEMEGSTIRDKEWGFTVVRREPGATGEASSRYRYLAPVCLPGVEKRQVLCFPSDTLGIFPALGDPHPLPYGREATHGSLIKLYEYKMSHKSNVVSSRPNLRISLEMLLAGTGFPIRIFECRTAFKGHKGSFATDIQGVVNRLNKDQKGNIEPGFPITLTLTIGGDDIRITVYAFVRGGAKSYKQSEGVIYLLNGQAHAVTRKTFFSNKSVNLSYLKDDLLVVVDLSQLSTIAREDMVMASRDRLSKLGQDQIEASVAALLKENQTLSKLQSQRHQEDYESKLADDKPLENLLKEMLKRNPALTRLLGFGSRLSNPFDVRPVDPKPQFQGKDAPTYFRYRGKPEGHKLCRESQVGKKLRIDFETDGCNEFFGQQDTNILLTGALDGIPLPITDHSRNPDNGTIHVHLRLPDEVKVGQVVSLRVDLISPLLLTPFVNFADLKVVPIASSPGGKGDPKQPPSEKPGSGQQGTQGVDMPKTIPRIRESWNKTPLMNQHSALCVMTREEDGRTMYDYHINMDNLFLLNELKRKPKDTILLRNRYKLALVLIGLSLIHDHEKPWTTPNVDSEDASDAHTPIDLSMLVERTTRAFAPIVLPLIAGLANLSREEEILDDDEEEPMADTEE